jgi:hypothetical protein
VVHKIDSVRVLTAATGNSTTITLGARFSDTFMTPADAGAIDGRVYTWRIDDVIGGSPAWEIVKGVYTASGTTASRTTVLAARSGGTLSTTRLLLSGTAQVRIIEAAEDMDGVRGTRTVTSTSDVLSNNDLGYVVTYSNASAVAVSLAQAAVSNLFMDGWSTWVQNLGVGTVTITPATSTINTAATLALATGMGAFIWSDGTNYHAYFVPVSKPLLAANNLSDVNPAAGRAALVAQAQGDYAGMSNGTLAASASGGALTVAVKTFAGADPSSGDPVYFYFRDATLGTGDFTRIAVTAALSVVLGSTHTLGFVSGTAGRVWITAHNDAGTVRIGTIKCSDAAGIFCPQEHLKFTTAVPANTTKTFYSTTAVTTAAPWRFIGFCEWFSLTTAGTWTAPDVVQLFGPGIKKPGDLVNTTQNSTSTPTTVNSTTPTSSALTLSPVMSSKANLLELFASGTMVVNAITYGMSSIFSLGASSEIGSMAISFGGEAGTVGTNVNYALDFPNTLTPTYVISIKNNNGAGTITYPVSLPAVLTAKELMG